MMKQDEAFAKAIEEAANEEFQPDLRYAAARYAAALLIARPDDETCLRWQRAVERELDELGPRRYSALGKAIDTFLERDDEDTDETARLIFEALAK